MIILSDVRVNRRLQIKNLYVKAGTSCHILGENGAGKSTLLRVSAGLLDSETGACKFHGQPLDAIPLSRLATLRGFHEQANTTAFDIPAGDYIDFYADNGALDKRLTNALDIAHLLHRPVSQLSGGEQQRINLVRCMGQVWSALENGKAMLCLDEPLQGLDVRHQQSLLLFLRTLCEMGNTVLMSSHDLNLSARFADQVVLLKAGNCIASGPVETTLTTAKLKACFNIGFDITNNQNALQIQPQWPSA